MYVYIYIYIYIYYTYIHRQTTAVTAATAARLPARLPQTDGGLLGAVAIAPPENARSRRSLALHEVTGGEREFFLFLRPQCGEAEGLACGVTRHMP